MTLNPDSPQIQVVLRAAKIGAGSAHREAIRVERGRRGHFRSESRRLRTRACEMDRAILQVEKWMGLR